MITVLALKMVVTLKVDVITMKSAVMIMTNVPLTLVILVPDANTKM
jgi:hypothetical protein